ncbi:PiggyBac transposable element-derived protein [Trinorchestia longiramus]|nr:PiggyBac transposable element-derived protein [Trinorchestia longiramus]
MDVHEQKFQLLFAVRCKALSVNRRTWRWNEGNTRLYLQCNRGVEETVEHLFLECSKYEHERESLMDVVHEQCGEKWNARSSRKDFPQLCGDKSLKRGDFDYRSTPSGITVFKWHDSKPVHLISNYHDVEDSTVQRRNKKGIKLTVTCPSVVTDYNKHMGGVDKHDMMKQLYGSDRKSKKWWHRLFLMNF